MNTISIDIGIKNLGYAILYENILSFGILDLSQHIPEHSIVIQRISILYDFIEDLIKKYDLQKAVVEKQVHTNTVAMELMYSIISILYSLNIREIIIFDPKLKFTKLKQSYNTKNKNHKKLAIRMTELLLQYNNTELLDMFSTYSKKDDISDAILMLYLETTSDEDINNFIYYLQRMLN